MTMSLDEKQSQLLGTQQTEEIMREWTLKESCTQWLWLYIYECMPYIMLYMENERHERNDRQIKKTHTERLNEHTTEWTNERGRKAKRGRCTDFSVCMALPLQSIDVCRVNRWFDSYNIKYVRSQCYYSFGTRNILVFRWLCAWYTF